MITFKFVLIYDDCNNLNLSFLYIFFILFADVYNLLLCNVYSEGPQGRLDLSNCVASVNKVVIIIIIIITKCCLWQDVLKYCTELKFLEIFRFQDVAHHCNHMMEFHLIIIVLKMDSISNQASV